MSEILRAESISYTRGGSRILSDVSLSINSGEHWIFLGPNGSGKSTLIKILTVNEWPTTGRIFLKGRSPTEYAVRELSKDLSLFEPALHLETAVYHPSMSALDVIATGADQSLAIYTEPSEETYERAGKLAQQLTFPPDRAFSLLSTGEQRRTVLLRALMRQPAIMILDEPFESLDLKGRFDLEKIIENVARYATIITAIHRLEEIPTFATHVLMIQRGRIFRAGSLEENLNSASVSELYGVRASVEKHSGRWICSLN